MANFQTNIGAKVRVRGAAGLADQSLYNGEIRYLFATLTTDSGMAANDTFDIGPPLPAGARVIPQLSRFMAHADPGTTLTIDIGDAADTDRYCDGAVVQQIGIVEFCTPATPAAVITPLKFTTATAVVGKIATAGTVTDDIKIDIFIAYLV